MSSGFDIEGNVDGRGLRIRIVASKYNRAIVDALLSAAVGALRTHHVKREEITVVRVPGAFEIPLALALDAERFDAQIALGCVIKGETAHFDQVVGQCGRGLMDVMLRSGVPVAFGVLAVDSIRQAEARAGATSNRGEEAALAALEAADVVRRMKASPDQHE